MSEENLSKYLRIFEKNGNYQIMERDILYEIIDSLLVLINAEFPDKDVLGVNQIMNKNNGIIKSCHGIDEIQFALSHLG